MVGSALQADFLFAHEEELRHSSSSSDEQWTISCPSSSLPCPGESHLTKLNVYFFTELSPRPYGEFSGSN